jgi:hypothetical protein
MKKKRYAGYESSLNKKLHIYIFISSAQNLGFRANPITD